MVSSLSRSARWLGVVAALCASAPAWAAEVRVGGRANLSAGADSNPTREYAGQLVAPEPMASLQLGLDGRLASERWYVAGAYDGGARGYAFTGMASTLTQALSVAGSHQLSSAIAVGLDGRLKDRRGGGRDYSDLAAGPFAELALGQTALRARVQLHRFLYRPIPTENFGSADIGVAARHRIDRHHSIGVSLDGALRRYGVAAWSKEGRLPLRREDLAGAGAISWAYRGPFAVGAGYSLSTVLSNSHGQTRVRHRFTANAGVRLPWEWMVFAQVALQLDQYPDGVFLSPEVTLLEDDENTSSAALRLVRPLTAALDLELRYAVYQAHFRESDLTYLRQLATAGVTFRF